MLQGFRVYDADAHGSLSPRMWQDLPEPFRARRPRPVTIHDGDGLGNFNAGWLIEGSLEPHALGPGAQQANTPRNVLAEFGANTERKHCSIASMTLSDPQARLVEHVQLKLKRFELHDGLTFGFGDVAQDHVGAIVDLHPLRTAGADRHSGRRYESRRRPDGGPGERLAELLRCIGSFGEQGFEDEFVRLFEGIPDAIAEPVRIAIERVKGAEQINGRVRVSDNEHRGFLLRERGRARRCGG